MSQGFLFHQPSQKGHENFSFQDTNLSNHIMILYKENVELRNELKELKQQVYKMNLKLNKIETKVVLTEFEKQD